MTGIKKYRTTSIVRVGAFYTLILLLLACCELLWAHGNIHERLQEASELLSEDPEEVSHYVRRALLYVENKEFENALADIERANALEGEFYKAEFYKAFILWSFANQTDPPSIKSLSDSRELLIHYLSRHPTDHHAHFLLARNFVVNGEREKAVPHFYSAIELTTDPTLELYLEHIKNLEGLGRIDDSIKSLQQAINRIDKSKELVEYAIKLELERGNLTLALAWFDHLPESSQNLPSTLIFKGTLLMKAKKPKEARKILCDAKNQLEKLPENVRNSPRIIQLFEDLHEVEESLTC